MWMVVPILIINQINQRRKIWKWSLSNRVFAQVADLDIMMTLNLGGSNNITDDYRATSTVERILNFLCTHLFDNYNHSRSSRRQEWKQSTVDMSRAGNAFCSRQLRPWPTLYNTCTNVPQFLKFINDVASVNYFRTKIITHVQPSTISRVTKQF